jgi:hypothetical protein
VRAGIGLFRIFRIANKRGCFKTSVFGTAALLLVEKPDLGPVFPRSLQNQPGFGTRSRAV